MSTVPETTNVPWNESDISSGDPDKLTSYLKKLIIHLSNRFYPDLANGINNLNKEFQSVKDQYGDTTTISANTDDLSVSEISTVFASTSGSSITIGGLKGGVTGQKLDIVKTSSSNNLVIEHVEGVGTQDIYTNDASDVTLTSFGGVHLTCNGSNWFMVSE